MSKVLVLCLYSWGLSAYVIPYLNFSDRGGLESEMTSNHRGPCQLD